jgi:hypothetical protein
MAVRGSNIEGPAGNRANNGYLPLTRDTNPVRAPNTDPGGCRENGTMPTSGSSSPVRPPNETPMRPGSSLQRSNPVAVSFGEGSVPVGPPPFDRTTSGTIPRGGT